MRQRKPKRANRPLRRRAELRSKADANQLRPGPLERKTPLRAKPKPRRTTREASLARAWHDRIMASPTPPLIASTERTTARVAGREGAGMILEYHAHHIITQQVLRARARELGVAEETLLWDPRVGMKVSKRRHERHHSRHEPILRRELPAGVWAFAREHGLTYRLERDYPPGN